MFPTQPSAVVTIFTRLNYSQPIHKTIVVTQGDMALDFSLKPVEKSQDWVVNIVELDKMTGVIRLNNAWKQRIRKHKHKHRAGTIGS